MLRPVGFIGLGNMGRPMALNLVKHGFPLVVNDIDPAKVVPLLERGARAEESAERVAATVERTICIVETTAQAESVIAGERGIVKSAKPGHIVICMSTIDPFAARRLAETLAARGVAMLDAPVSGGTERAKSGELSIIAGGDQATFDACNDVFKAMGTNLFHVGPLGSGLAMKLVNNMLIQVNTVAIAEAFVMGAKAGLDPKVMYDVIKVSTGASFALDHRVPRMITGDFKPGGTVDISYKDQELETAFAKSLGVPLLLANVSQQVYQMARALGFAKEDGASIVKVYEQMAGVKLGPR
jgi:2-hydroxymethylglutarate dehydrogenase